MLKIATPLKLKDRGRIASQTGAPLLRAKIQKLMTQNKTSRWALALLLNFAMPFSMAAAEPKLKAQKSSFASTTTNSTSLAPQANTKSVQIAGLENKSYLDMAPVNSELKEDKKSQISYKFAIGGSQFQSETSQSAQATTKLQIDFTYKPLSWLKLEVSPIASFESGAQQNFSTSPIDQNNKIFLRKAIFDLTPAPWASLSVGVEDLQEVHDRILFDDRAFAGARSQFFYEINPDQNIGFFAETLIPSSSSLASDQNEMSKTPGFDSAGLSFETKYNYRSQHLVRLNYFQFRNLPMGSALQSGLLGNRTENISEVEARFIHNYQGFEGILRSDWILTKNIDFGLRGQYVSNSGSPDENQAYLGGFIARYYLNKSKSRLGLYLLNYHIESDAVVASYASRILGYANRNGFGGEVFYELMDPSVKVSLGGYDSNVIFVSPTQNKETLLFLKVEVKNVSF